MIELEKLFVGVILSRYLSLETCQRQCRYPSTGLQGGQKVTKGFVPQKVAILANPMFPYVM